MRLDKYLKVSRLIKRRTLAKELCDAGRVEVAGRVAKAGTEVAVGDTVAIRFGTRRLQVRIEQIAQTVGKAQAAELYTVIKDERQAQDLAEDDPS
ncbi:MAG: RNA-binding S4 domain-containing protein [Firmicutes bacterium]|nr:RNA-binding S4 domain-containing protein [Bacillota bacterium]